MPIPTGTAAISFSQLRAEMNAGAGGGYVSFPMQDGNFRSRLTDTAVGTQISLSSLRGNAYQRFTIAADNSNSPYDIRAALVAAGWNGTAKGSADVVINSGVVVSASATGAYAMDTGTGWPAPSTIVVYNNGGYVVGMGGAGGDGGDVPGSSGVGLAGGPALRAQRAMTLVNSGTVGGGGGGGGGGSARSGTNPATGAPFKNAGGGGGGGRTGRTNSAGGAKGVASGPGNLKDGVVGAPGTFAGAGLGGDPPDFGTGGFAANSGGDGGDWGAQGNRLPGVPGGSLGGASGVAIQGWSVVTRPTGTTGIMGPTAG